MGHIDFIAKLHKKTNRNYLARVNNYPKAEAAHKAKQWDYDYWDGDRNICYGGYYYDGRWRTVAKEMCQYYDLKPGSRLLDIGCGKGFLLYEFTQIIPDIEVVGIDISEYAIMHAKEEIKNRLIIGRAEQLAFDDNSFDLIISINTLHNLYCHNLNQSLREIERVGNKHKYLCVESYRNETEKVNLLYWQVTCEMFCTPKEWQWWFKQCGYSGDYSFIYFE